MTQNELLELATDELSTANHRITKVHVEHAIDCENASLDEQPEPALTKAELKTLRAASLEVQNAVRYLEQVLSC